MSRSHRPPAHLALLLAAACGGGGAGAPPDGGAPLGDVPCATDDDCPSGRCLNLTQGVGVESGYCSLGCATDVDCAAMGDGQVHACLDAGGGLGPRCVRTCRAGFGCGLPTDVCSTDFPIGGGQRDVCIDTRRAACTADRDCEPGRFCTPVRDREGLQRLCLTPRGPEGAPTPFEPDRAGVGEACDPTLDLDGPGAPFCDDPSECPGDACFLRADRQRVCHPPAEARCALFCNPFGQCAGLCDEDGDCPGDMRCSRLTVANPQVDPDVFDDTWQEEGICTYAAGSRAPCAREADCAATGPGGARETCVPTTNAAGDLMPICVTPVAGVGLPGDACGDDPATDAVEVRECHGSCESFTCAGVCATSEDCAPGRSCRAFLLDTRRTVRFCAPDAGCTRDADCAVGEACVPTPTATAFEGRCEPAGGLLPPGSRCTVPEENVPAPAASRCSWGCLDTGGLEEDGRCTATCATDADCPGADFVCVVEERTLVGGGTLDRADDVTAPLRYCRHLPSRGAPCDSALDCGGLTTCAAWRPAAGGAAERRCVATAGGAPIGASCRGDVPCRDRVCFADWFEPDFPYCTGLCDAATNCPPGLECRVVVQVDARATDVRQCVLPDDARAR